MRFVFIYILFYLGIGLTSAQTIKTISVKLDTINAKNILLLQKDKHMLGIQVLKNEKLNILGNKISDTLYIYIHNKNNVDTLTTNFKMLEQRLKDENLKYYKNGYIFNKLIADSIAIKNKNIRIFYTLKNTNTLLIDSISFSKKMPKNMIKNINKHFLKKRINQKNITFISNYITKHTTFIATKKNRLFFKKNINILDFSIHKAQKNSIDGLVGFRYENEKKTLSLTGEVNSHLYNMFNANEEIHFRWQKNTHTQNYLINTSFPFLFGSNFGVNNNFSLQQKDSTEIAVYNQIEATWQFENHRLGMHYIIDTKDQINTVAQKSNYLGFQYRYHWLPNDKLTPFGLSNQTINNISINTNADRFSFFIYNQVNLTIKTFNHQGIKVSGINYYTNQNFDTNFINTKNNIYRDNYQIIEGIKSMQILKSAYYFVNDKQIFYSIHDFVNENMISLKHT